MTVSTDKMTSAQHNVLAEAIEATFAQMTKFYDVAVQDSLSRFQAAQRVVEHTPEHAQLVESALQAHRFAELLKALIWCRYPAGALDWFGRDD